jgi:hypothetical protein
MLPVHVHEAKSFKTCEGSAFYNSPTLSPTTIPTIQAAQAYSSEVTVALENAGFTVRKLVLSHDVHRCYEFASCENAVLGSVSDSPSMFHNGRR